MVIKLTEHQANAHTTGLLSLNTYTAVGNINCYQSALSFNRYTEVRNINCYQSALTLNYYNIEEPGIYLSMH